MTCRHCKEDIYPKDHGGYYHIRSWVEITADHDADPIPAQVTAGNGR